MDIHFTERDWERLERDWVAWWAGDLERPMVMFEGQVHIQWIPGDGQPPPEEWLPLLQRIRDGGKLCQLYVTPEGARTIVRELGWRGFALYIWEEMDKQEADDSRHSSYQQHNIRVEQMTIMPLLHGQERPSSHWRQKGRSENTNRPYAGFMARHNKAQ